MVITEVGGTVGDIESLPFLEAIRQIRHEIGRDNVLLPPRVAAALHRAVRRAEDQADPALGGGAAQHRHPARRASCAGRTAPISDGLKRKISLMCDVDEEAVVVGARRAVDLRHPEGAARRGPGRLRRCAGSGLPFRDVDWTDWDDLLGRVHRPARSVTIALVGKYVDLPDAYLSPAEALRAGGFGNDARVDIRWVPSDDCQTPGRSRRAHLDGVDGILIPGGFGVRGIEGKIGAVRYARVNEIPILGLCLGLQCMAIEVARDLAGLDGANCAEFDPRNAAPGDRHHGRPGGRRGRRAGHGRHDAARACTRPCWPRAAIVGEPVRRRDRVTSGTGTGTRSTTPTGPRSKPPGWSAPALSPDGRLVEFVELPHRRAPVLRRHPGAPGVPVPADQAAPAVQRPHRGRARAGEGQACGAGGARDRQPLGRERMSAALLARRPRRAWPVVASESLAPGRSCSSGATPCRCPTASRSAARWSSTPVRSGSWRSTRPTRSLLIRQYRHPVGRLLWEIPAGLRDVAGEPPLETARRELLEEAGYLAADWRVLADFFTSPGISSERLRVFLARGLTPVPDAERGYVPDHEEAHLVIEWVPLDAVVSRIPGRRPAQRRHGARRAGRVRRRAGRIRRLRGAGEPER